MEFLGTEAGRVTDGEPLNKAVPTLFIGLGGTGKQILMRFRKRLFDAHRVPKLPHSRFLLLDTDMQSLVPPGEREEEYRDCVLRSEEGEAISCGITPGDFQTVLDGISLKKDPRWGWMHPDMQTYPSTAFMDGAGTIRQAGRLSFFLKYPAIRIQLEEHIRQLHAYATNNMETVDTKRMEFVLITSLSGGTGSGMFIDVAFLLRDILMRDPILNNAIERRHTTMIAVLPTIFTRDDRSLAGRFQQNAYASLLEMEYYNTPRPEDTFFMKNNDEAQPGSVAAVNERIARTAGAAPVVYRPAWAPYEIRATAWDTCYLIDDINDRRPGADTSSKELYQMIADYLYLDFDSNPFAVAKRSARSNNVQMRDRIVLDEVYDDNRLPIFANRYGSTFSSFGLAEMLIDRDKICRAASYRMAYRMVLNLWLGRADATGENTYKKMMEADLYEKNTLPGMSVGLALHPNTLWRALLEAEGRDWYKDADGEFDQVKGETPDDGSSGRLESLMSKHEKRLGPGGEVRAAMEQRKIQLGGTAVELGIGRKLVSKATSDRFNSLGAETTLQLLTFYYTTFEMARKWAMTQAGQPIDKPQDVLARQRDAERVASFPYNRRGKAIDVIYPYTCEDCRTRTLARYQAEGCRTLEGLATILQEYVGKPGKRDATARISPLTHDYTEIKDYLVRLRNQLDERFNLTKRANDTPRKKLFLPEWDGPQYDEMIVRALLDRVIPAKEGKFDWMALEKRILEALPLPAGTTDRTRLGVIKQWMKIPSDEELGRRIEELSDVCYRTLQDHMDLEEFKNGYVVDYVVDRDDRKEYLTNLVFYSAPYLPKIGNHSIDNRFPPHYVNLLGWVAGDEVRREKRDVILHGETHGISINQSDNHKRDEIKAPSATVPTCIALVREMTGVPLNYYSRLPTLKQAYDNPIYAKYKFTCHLDSMEQDLPDIDAITPPEHEQLRNGAETALRALVLRWIYYEAPDFVVEVKDPNTSFGSVKWHLGSRITRILKHACVNDSIRNSLAITWNNWRSKATTSQLAALHMALQLTLNMFSRDAGYGQGADPARRPPLENCFRKVQGAVGRDLLDKGAEGAAWMDLFTERNQRDHDDYELWVESYARVTEFIKETCLRSASKSLPIWQVDQREVNKVTLAAAMDLIPNWSKKGTQVS